MLSNYWQLEEGEHVFEGHCHIVYNSSAVKMLFVWLEQQLNCFCFLNDTSL